MGLTLPISADESTQTTQTTEIRKFRPDIEGLRAIAVLMVMLDHAGLGLLSGGYIGVDVFFVLSGFLITGLLLREIASSGGVSVTRFYARRARRLLPAATIVIVTTVLASYAFVGDIAGNRAAEDARWTALFASNFRFIQQGTDYLGAQLPPSPLQHFWSLAVEEQFYFVWPFLIIIVAGVAKRIPIQAKLSVVLTGIIIGSLLLSMQQTATNATEAYFSPFTRASELAAGALLAVAAPWLLSIPSRLGAGMGWLGVAIVIATGLRFDATTSFPGLAVVIPVLGTVLAVAGGTIAPERGVEKVLALRPFQWIGKLSYSLYLWHWPVLIVVAGWAGRDLTVAESLMLYVPTLALSAATYFVVEDPVRSASILTSRPPLASVGLGACLVAVSVGLCTWMINSHPSMDDGDAPMAEIASTAGVLQAVAQGEFITTWPEQPPRIRNLAYSDDCDVSRLDTTSAACVLGDPNAERTVVVYGDSHAAMWIPAFDEIGRRSNWRVVQLTKPGCQAPDYPSYSRTLNREYTECAEFREFALDKIDEIQPDVVVVTSARRGALLSVNGEPTTDGLDEAWAAGLDSVLTRLEPMAGRVVVLGDMAYPNEKGIDCLTAHPGDVPACNTPRSDAVDAEHNDMEKQIALEHGADYVDVTPWYCTDTVCPAVVADLTTHRDALHTSENYVVWLSSALGEATGLTP